MADIIDCGVVKVIALKKSGSSEISRAFAQHTWEPYGEHWDTPRYVTAIRNPGLRLVSCWQHLVKQRYDDRIDPNHDHNFGPATCFDQWVVWVLAQSMETLNPHMRMQTYELADHLSQLPQGIVFVTQLEQVTPISCGAEVKPMTEFLGRRVCVRNQRKRRYAPWLTQYDRVQLQQVRRHFAGDWHLWNHLYATGYRIFDSHALAKMLNLTNGRHSCIV